MESKVYNRDDTNSQREHCSFNLDFRKVERFSSFTDNTPPSFSNTCPGNKVFYTGKCSSHRTLRRWKEPVATDNSGHVSIRYPVIRPPVNLSIGLYNVMYSAIDSSGNGANCSFIVEVASKSSPLFNLL